MVWVTVDDDDDACGCTVLLSVSYERLFLPV